MRRILDRIPGPMPLRVLIIVILLVVAIVVLGLVFEWAGDLLDDGGTIGV